VSITNVEDFNPIKWWHGSQEELIEASECLKAWWDDGMASQQY